MLYRLEACTTLSYKLKLNEKCEITVIEYLKACVQIANAFLDQGNDQFLEQHFERYRQDSDDVGLIALYKLMTIVVSPLVPNQKSIVQRIKLDSLSIIKKQKQEFFQLYSALKQAFS